MDEAETDCYSDYETDGAEYQHPHTGENAEHEQVIRNEPEDAHLFG